MSLSLILLFLSAALYALAFVFHLLSFFGAWEGGDRPGFSFMRVGFLVSTFYFLVEALEHGFFLPVTNFSQALAFFAWALAFVYLVLLVRIQSEPFGLVLTPTLFILVSLAASASAKNSGVTEPLNPILLNPYFALHMVTAFFAYASFTLSFAAGLLYLIQHHELKSKRAGTFYHKLPSLEVLEKMIYQPLFWGAPLLLAAVGIGFMGSKSAYGEYWLFDPKTLATILTVIVYFAILYLHSFSSLRGRQGAIFTLLAFALVLFSFVGMRFIQGSHHFM